MYHGSQEQPFFEIAVYLLLFHSKLACSCRLCDNLCDALRQVCDCEVVYHNMCWDLVGDERFARRLFCKSVELALENKTFFLGWLELVTNRNTDNSLTMSWQHTKSTMTPCYCMQLLQQRLSYKSAKPYATTSNDIMDNAGQRWLDWT